jgi:hypothetical protein
MILVVAYPRARDSYAFLELLHIQKLTSKDYGQEKISFLILFIGAYCFNAPGSRWIFVVMGLRFVD